MDKAAYVRYLLQKQPSDSSSSETPMDQCASGSGTNTNVPTNVNAPMKVNVKKRKRYSHSIILKCVDAIKPSNDILIFLGNHLNMDFTGYKFTYESEQELEKQRTVFLAQAQCDGLVEIYFRVTHELKSVDIVKILQPPKDTPENVTISPILDPESDIGEYLSSSSEKEDSSESVYAPSPPETEAVRRPRKPKKRESPDMDELCDKLDIPENFKRWNNDHIQEWVIWAIGYYGLPGLDVTKWTMTGKELLKMTKEELKALIPAEEDSDNRFWQHIKTLRRKHGLR